MEEIVKLVTDAGISLACVAYLMYFQLTYMAKFNTLLENLNNNITVMNERLTKIEDKLGD